MKKIIIIILILVAGKFGYERYNKVQAEVAATARKQGLAKAVEDMNKRLPQEGQYIRLEKVELADGLLRYTGTLLNGLDLTDEMKAATKTYFKNNYCEPATLPIRQENVSVDYSIRIFAIKNINDKVREQTFSTVIRPEDCK